MLYQRVELPQSRSGARPKVLLLHTGGTLGGLYLGTKAPVAQPSFEQDEGLQSSPALADFCAQLERYCPEIFDLVVLAVDVVYEADSSNLSCRDWALLCSRIEAAWDDFDAFVIVHGTDTLAYCASFLSLAIVQPNKPIVITGSQRPLRELRSDARMNLIDSIQLAVLGRPGVLVCFDSHVYLGSRVSKVSNLALEAFHSPNYPTLGHFGVEIGLHPWLLVRESKSEGVPLHADVRADENVICLSAVPGGRLHQRVREAILESTHGILIEGFGLGHAPTQHGDWLALCEEAQKRNIPVVMTSQCRNGRIELAFYPVGCEFLARGVIPSQDMTRECATIKLMMMLGRQVPKENWNRFMTKPIHDELSESFETHGAGEGTR